MEHVTKIWWLWAKRCLAPDPRPTPLLSRAVPKTAVSMPPVTGLQHLHRHTNLFQSSLRYPQWCLVPTLMIIWVEQQVQTSHLFYSWTWHSAPLWYDLNWLFSTIKILSLKEFYPLIQNEIHSLTWHTWQRLCLWLLCDCTMRFEEQVLDWHTLWLIIVTVACAVLFVAPPAGSHATRVPGRLRLDHLRMTGFVNGRIITNWPSGEFAFGSSSLSNFRSTTQAPFDFPHIASPCPTGQPWIGVRYDVLFRAIRSY